MPPPAPLSSSASALSSSGSSSMLLAGPAAPAADELRHDCGYCANGKTLRDILPPKKCDYCFKFKCQFCTLRLPLIKVRKGLPKAMKGNSRICLHCFHYMWTDHAALSASSGTDTGPSARRASLGGLSRRGSTSGSSRGGAAAAWDEDDDDGPLRDSILRDSFNTGGSGEDASLEAIDEGPAPPPPPSATQRVARALGLVIRSDSPKPQDVVHIVDLWLSLFAAATLLAVVLVEHLTVQQRVAFCVVIYGGFLAVHPWIHNATVAMTTTRTPPSLLRRRSSVSSARKSVSVVEPERSERLSLAYAPSDTVPEVFQPAFRRMQERFDMCLSDPTQWKLVKTTSGGKIYDVPNDLPQTLFLIDMFVPGISIAEFLDYMNRTDLKDRAVWDWNVAAFEIVDDYKDDHTSLIYNAQKSFLGGFVSARDFCLLYKRSPTSTIFASVEHPKVPERPNATRGVVHLAGLNCTPSTTGEDGFQLQYMAQVDINGNIPARLMYSGQVDNMEKMIKSFRQAHKLFRATRT